MYGEVQGTSIVPPVVAGATVTALPTTGAGFITSAAIAVAAGLVAWALVYFYRLKVAQR